MKHAPGSKIQDPGHKGFTLMEMIVTLGIFTMMTLLYTANFRGFQQGLIVETDADRVASAIRQAQLYALTGELIGGVRPAGGYGFNITAPCVSGTCTFLLFGDTCNPAAHRYDSGCDIVVRAENLKPLVNVTSVAPASPLDAVFTFPTATPYVNGTPAQNATTTLTHRGDASKTKSIVLDGVSGQITIQ